MSKPIEIPFTTTLLVRDTCLCLHVQRAARALARRFDDALRPAGLTNGQFSLLMSLNRPEPPSMGAVAALLAMDRTTLTAALKPLERRRLVAITPDPADRRSRLLGLTPEGRLVLSSAIRIWKQTHRTVEALLTDTGSESFRESLRALS
jgi:DNA-binding MarR family transcriptional regulator